MASMRTTMLLKKQHRQFLFLSRNYANSKLISQSSNNFEADLYQDEKNIEAKKRKHKPPLFDRMKMAQYMLKKSDPSIDTGSIYIKHANAGDQLMGRRKSKLRYVWEEQDCTNSFPDSPEAANLDLPNYIEQRDMWRRRQVLNIPKFCVGSIMAVTKAEQYSPEGFMRFVGICIHINPHQNTKGALFGLRNVIKGEPLDIFYSTYNPLIQKIEVLRHERWENEMEGIGLRFLRDFPPEYSTIDENFPAEEYTEEPHVRKWTVEDKQKVKEWFDAIYESRRRVNKFAKTPIS